MPFRKMSATGPCLARDLHRLAVTSPHLLADLGFHEESSAGGPGHQVWRRGDLRVTISRAAAAVDVDIGG